MVSQTCWIHHCPKNTRKPITPEALKPATERLKTGPSPQSLYKPRAPACNTPMKPTGKAMHQAFKF